MLVFYWNHFECISYLKKMNIYEVEPCHLRALCILLVEVSRCDIWDILKFLKKYLYPVIFKNIVYSLVYYIFQPQRFYFHFMSFLFIIWTGSLWAFLHYYSTQPCCLLYKQVFPHLVFLGFIYMECIENTSTILVNHSHFCYISSMETVPVFPY